MMLLEYWSGLPQQPTATAAPTAEHVFRRHVPRLYSLARRMLGNDADAEDVVGDVLVVVLRKLDRFRGDAEVTTWLHRVTVNAALMLRRKRACRPDQQAAVPLTAIRGENHFRTSAAQTERPDKPVLDGEMCQQVEGAIARLPRLYRDVVVLADVERLPNAEIARLLGVSLAAVKSRLHQGRLRLRKALTAYFA